MPQVIRARDTPGKLQMRHILFHVLLSIYQDLVQSNFRFYRTGMIVDICPDVEGGATRRRANGSANVARVEP